MEEEKTDFNTIKKLFKSNIITIIMIITILCIGIFIINYFNIFNHMIETGLLEEIEFALNFKGFDISETQQCGGEEVVSDDIIEGTNNHMLIFGASGTGKTTFLKKYLKKNNINKIKVFCSNTSEWTEDVIETNYDKLSNFEYLKNHTIILDDQGCSNLYAKTTKIVTEGRHHNIRLIILYHYSTDANPKTRNGIFDICITTGNQLKFFEDLKDKFGIPNFSGFKHIKHGIIRYNLNTGLFVVYDMKYKKIYDHETNQVSLRSDFDIGKFLNQTKLTETEKSEIEKFLESKGNINLTPPLLMFYLNYYLLQKGYKVNINKLRHILKDYFEENRKFKKENIIPLATLCRNSYSEFCK